MKELTVEERFEMYLHQLDWVQKHIAKPRDKTVVNEFSISSVKLRRK